MRLADLLTIVGLLVLVGGVALMHIPTAMIVGGALVVVAGERASSRPPTLQVPAQRAREAAR